MDPCSFDQRILTAAAMEESAGPGGENVKVVVRVRPLNTAETREGFRVITKVNTIDGTIRVEMPKKVSHPDDTPAKIFTFDTVFAPEVTDHQQSFYLISPI